MQIFSRIFIPVCFVLVTAYIVLRAFSVKRTVERGTRWWRLWMWAAAALVVILRRSTADARVVGESPLWSIGFESSLIADVLTLVGMVVVVWARATLGGYWSSNVVLKQDHEVVER